MDVCETDEDEVTVLLDGDGLGTQNLQQETHRGDILAVILSGMQQHSGDTGNISSENDHLVVRKKEMTTQQQNPGGNKRKTLSLT